MAKKAATATAFVPCSIRELPPDQHLEAAAKSVEINPANRPRVEGLPLDGVVLTPAHLAALTSKFWGAGGVELTVSFPFDSTPQDLQARIVQHANAWGQWCKVKFHLTTGSAQVRVARTPGDGYWSYLGNDILHIPANQPTLNLDSFTMRTPESEFHRVVRHEFGHALSFPHEHMRREIVSRLDVAKTIAYFMQTQGWSEQVVKEQVLTPLDEASIMGTPRTDQDSIMCYQLPGSITTDGQPVRGGIDIDAVDQAFAAKLYPLAVTPPPPPPPSSGLSIVLARDVPAGMYKLAQ